MDINKIGMTAFIISGVRELEDNEKHPLFSDPYAKHFVNDEIRVRVAQLKQLHPAMGDLIRMRTVAINSIVRSEIRRGVHQVVTLGAGFDMRHAIFASKGVQFWDIDQPAVMEFKKATLSKAGVATCPSIQCNYLDVDLPQQLADAGLDLSAETLFIWEGNTMYLPSDRIFGFLRSLCDSMPNFRICFDYLPNSLLEGTFKSAEAIELVGKVQQVMNVTFSSGFDTLDEFETQLAMRVIESGTCMDVGLRHAGPDAEHSVTSASDISPELKDAYNIAFLAHET